MFPHYPDTFCHLYYQNTIQVDGIKQPSSSMPAKYSA